MKLVDFQNRLTVFVQWGWSYLTKNRSARLITRPLQSSIDTLLPNTPEPFFAEREGKLPQAPTDGEDQSRAA